MTGRLADPPSADRPAEKSAGKLSAQSTAPTAAAAGLTLYSGEIARHEISVVTRPIAIDNLPAAFQNFRIVQISDIHYDEFTEPAFVDRVIRHVNALAPDLVALTGDFISFGPLPRTFTMSAMERCATALSRIACPARFAVMGNHDSILGAPTIKPILAEVGIPLMVNEFAPIERAGQRLWLCGIHDPCTHVPNLHTAIPERPDGPVLLLSHGPDYADTVVTHPRGRFVDLMISGHTHGGQVRLPFLPPLHLPPGGQEYVEGLFRFAHLQLYVNRGIGTTGVPFRLNCPPEITLLTLQKS